ncbi:homoserine O-acetyltransferase [Temperatibacter marinus]|uniref:Homoserine O-acetyltransferase n=1 Tax=Temperatibacter marinus TaxID=1456591 RepID=A0AA52EIY9_9PROT|nr:homoserine O-acetyltransferase [Temperatibacter marinus]WND04023.1 homoserine O-acetyltransferase [Temperatibacter marinus]
MVKQAHKIASQVATLFETSPLILDSGVTLSPVQVAYETYGTLNSDKSNAIMICHALTGDQYVASTHPLTGKSGWWERIIGPNKLIDTNKYFVICSNVLGSCLGTTGPKEINPETGQIYGIDFPVITINDMVKVQVGLTDTLGIQKLFMVIGGSMGGMQALEWLVDYPDRVGSMMLLATAAQHSAQNIAFHEIGRQAVMADPEWRDGKYQEHDTFPRKGLSVARMTAHVTYLSEDGLMDKFGRNLQDRDAPTYGFEADFQIESYLRHQGSSFVDRFDANSYLYITRAMDYFDIAARYEGKLADAFKKASDVPCLVITFTSDWLYPPEENKRIAHALNAAGVPVSYASITSDRGHDSFLLDIPEMDKMMTGFIQSAEARLMKDQRDDG